MATKKTAKKKVTKRATKKRVVNKNSGKTAKTATGRPFKKGQSGNPNGRPKGQRNFKTIYREALVKLATLNKLDNPEDLEDKMIQKAIQAAVNGDHRFYKDVMDRIHGKPVQPHAGPDGESPIEHTIVYLPKRKKA